jgi:hypothetical protein
MAEGRRFAVRRKSISPYVAAIVVAGPRPARVLCAALRWTRWLPAFVLLFPTGAVAQEDTTPVFPGHSDLVVRTKEVALEGSATRLGDGSTTLSGGGAMAAFYKPWLSLLGGATFSPGLFRTRQHYDTRAVARLVWPEPVVGRLFVYGAAGLTVFFYEEPRDGDAFRRALGPVFGAGAFYQISDRIRIRLEGRDHWLFSGGDGMRHNLFGTLSLVTLYR